MHFPVLHYLYAIEGREFCESVDDPTLLQILDCFDKLNINRYEHMIYIDKEGNEMLILSAERERVYLRFAGSPKIEDIRTALLVDISLKDSEDEVKVADMGNVPYPIYKTVPKNIARFILAYHLDHGKLPQQYKKMWNHEFYEGFFDQQL